MGKNYKENDFRVCFCSGCEEPANLKIRLYLNWLSNAIEKNYGSDERGLSLVWFAFRGDVRCCIREV
jgi:hypothetical protein